MRSRTMLYKARENSRLWTGYLLGRFVKGVRVTGPPIFVVGCGHSGTSLLIRILGAHSRICAIPYETGFCLKDNPGRALRTFDRWAISEGKPRWAEKTPRHINHIAKLLEMCPEAKIVIIVRDGRDVAVSIRDRKGDIEKGIRRWVEDNRAGQEFWNHPNVYALKYEDLVEDFPTTMEAVLGFLGEKYEEGLHEYHTDPKSFYPTSIEKPASVSGKNHEQYRNWQINQPLFDGRGKWMSMTEDEKRIVKEHAAEMLIEYGYTTDDNW